jgi:peptidoglycan/LPS O-acetylase OafA/YrhL
MAGETLLEAHRRDHLCPSVQGEGAVDDRRQPGARLALPVRWCVERRIPALDALRGLAACSVLVQHSFQQHIGAGTPSHAGAIGQWLGAWGVALFFVLSGFCIHLPQARRMAEGDAHVSWGLFVKRRAWRLLPTHYASLIVAAVVACFASSALLSRPTVAAFLSHVFMVHTLSAATFGSINAVFWSIAIEVHFYLAYPILLRLRRRLGPFLVPFLLLVGLLTYLLASLSLDSNVRFVGQRIFMVSWWQWALGVALADIYVRGTARRFASIVDFRGAAWTWGFVSLLIGLSDPVFFRLHVRYWILPVVCALLLGALLVRPPRSRIFRVWERIGTFSYSLYLIHPVALALLLLLPLGSLPFVFRLTIDAVVALLSAWVFFMTVERKFLNAPSAVRTQPAASAHQPAPRAPQPAPSAPQPAPSA